MNTKSVQLTEDEVELLIKNHGWKIEETGDYEHTAERIKYLNKRLKDFKKADSETITEEKKEWK